MTRPVSSLATPALAVLAMLATGTLALGKEPTVKTTTIPAGRDIRLHTVTSLKKDCSNGSPGTLRITVPPKNGATSIRTGKRKTPASFRCPNVETAVQELIYKANAGFKGADEVTFEATNADGAAETFTIKLNVGSDKPGQGKDNKGGILDL